MRIFSNTDQYFSKSILEIESVFPLLSQRVDLLPFSREFLNDSVSDFDFGAGLSGVGLGFLVFGPALGQDAPLSTTIPGDVSTTATITVGGQVTETLEVSGDQDWFSITLVAGTTYDISSMGVGGTPLSDPLVRIVDSVGTQLATNDDIILGSVRHSLLTYTATTTGTYYVSAQAFSSQTGGYTLSVTETASADIAGNSMTTAVAVVDGSVSGTLEANGDSDWFAVTLTAGSRYKIANNGTGADALDDAFVSLYDASGTLIASNNNSGPGANALLAFNITTTGTYYVAASSFDGESDGDYAVSVQEVPLLVERTIDEVAHFLTDEFGSRTAYAVTAITYNITGLSADAAALAVRALTAWSDVSALTFTAVTSGGSIVFTNDIDPLDENDPLDTGANANNSNTTSGGVIISSALNVSSNWHSSSVDVDGYTYQTFLHEIGHALGLGHAGPYNGSATYNVDNAYLNDSWSYSVMSYFDQNESGYFGDYRFVLGPQIADIVAIQDLYGANATTRSGDTVYGFNSTEAATSGAVTGSVHNFANFTRAPSLSIYDMGGTDTLDLSGYSQVQRIDLNAEAFSDVNGISGVISIARGVVIENAIGGSGVDTITGNSANNELTGGQGNDILDGGAGTDYALYSGASVANYTVVDNGNGTFTVTDTVGTDGADTLSNIEFLRIGGVDTALGAPPAVTFTEMADVYTGTSGDDVLDALGGNDVIHGGDGADTISGGSGNDSLYGDGGADTLNGGADDDYLYIDSFDTISGGTGYDTVIAEDLYTAGITLNLGTAAVERVYATHLADVLDGSSATAGLSLYGYGGADTLRGGSGSDYLYFDSDDINSGVVNGGAGYDWLYNQDGTGLADLSIDLNAMAAEGYYGSNGTELITAAGATVGVTVYTNGGADTVQGGSGDDYVYFTSTTVSIHGGAGYDYAVFSTNDGSAVTLNLTTSAFESVTGRSGNDVFVATGSTGAVVMNGNEGSDTFTGGNGNDTINGGAGTDYALYSGSSLGNYTVVDNGNGTFTITDNVGSDGSDTLTDVEIIRVNGTDYTVATTSTNLTTGSDSYTGTTTNESIFGLAGNDVIHGGDGTNAISGGAGNDSLYGDGGADTLDGGDDDDYLYADATDTLVGGAGYDTVIIQDLYTAGVTINLGTAGIERVFATHVADVLDGSSSTTGLSLYGYAGADTLLGGSGGDYLYIDAADVVSGSVNGGAGYDWALNQDGTTAVSIGMDAMAIEGYYGSNATEAISAAGVTVGVTIYTNGGADTVQGGSGGDYIYFTNTTASINGGAGYDYAIYNVFDGSGANVNLTATAFEGAVGRGGNDVFDATGHTSSVSLYGYGGSDTLTGGTQTDYLYGGTGDDTLTGGASTDYFTTYANWGNDTITDFTDGSDIIIMTGTGATGFGDLVITQDGGDALISFGGNSIRLTGFTAANLTAADFAISSSAELPDVDKTALNDDEADMETAALTELDVMAESFEIADAAIELDGTADTDVLVDMEFFDIYG